MAETKKDVSVRVTLISMGLLAATDRLQKVKKVPASTASTNG